VRPRPNVHRATAGAAVPALALVLAVTGCSGSSPGPRASSAPGSTPAGPVAPSATAAAAFAVLPESVLTPLPPLTYTTPAGADAGMVAQGAKPAVNAVFNGGISRELTYQGKAVGGVELYRFGADVPADARERFVPLMVQSFAQVTPTAGTLGTTKVQVADGARGTTITVVGWTKGDDVILVWAQGVPATEQIAAQYIAQSG
jgi:hypothetical protein